MTIAGTAFFAVALAAAVFLVTLLVITSLYAAAGTAFIAGLVAWSWFYVPLRTFELKS